MINLFRALPDKLNSKFSKVFNARDSFKSNHYKLLIKVIHSFSVAKQLFTPFIMNNTWKETILIWNKLWNLELLVIFLIAAITLFLPKDFIAIKEISLNSITNNRWARKAKQHLDMKGEKIHSKIAWFPESKLSARITLKRRKAI